MDRKVRHQLPGQGEDARVGDEDGVDADIAEVNEIFRKAFQIFIVREDIDRDVNPLAQRMGVVDGFFQFFIGKVVAERPKAEGFSA